LETLQKCVCELLLKNQQLRMALTANEPERGHGWCHQLIRRLRQFSQFWRLAASA